jgi:hypothetical protein
MAVMNEEERTYKLRFQIPEMHYQTVEVEVKASQTIGDGLTIACIEGEGTPIGDVKYHKTLDAEDYPVRMVDEDGNVQASYWHDALNDKWEHQPAMWHGGKA